jgi:hypothetical protein
MARADALESKQPIGASRLWRAVLTFYLDKAPRPLMNFIRRTSPAVLMEEFVFVGRRTGQKRSLLLCLYDVDGTWYAGHPNGTSQWVRNLLAAGSCVVIRRGHEPVSVTASELPRGPERDRVIDATGRQPNPTGAIYRGAHDHVRAVGRYFRLTPASA